MNEQYEFVEAQKDSILDKRCNFFRSRAFSLESARGSVWMVTRKCVKAKRIEWMATVVAFYAWAMLEVTANLYKLSKKTVLITRRLIVSRKA